MTVWVVTRGDLGNTAAVFGCESDALESVRITWPKCYIEKYRHGVYRYTELGAWGYVMPTTIQDKAVKLD